jgi:hypothetical protein
VNHSCETREQRKLTRRKKIHSRELKGKDKCNNNDNSNKKAAKTDGMVGVKGLKLGSPDRINKSGSKNGNGSNNGGGNSRWQATKVRVIQTKVVNL